uniref:Uncharacterized protein n=1 Tax=Anguilla anguilla TaxID=7936 RepID=A0A0E9S3L3_ANGAN
MFMHTLSCVHPHTGESLMSHLCLSY